jgi:hypothetical protein
LRRTLEAAFERTFMSEDSEKKKEDEIYRVETVPPPPGEGDAYNAPTKVGQMPKEVLEAMKRAGVAPDGAPSSRPPPEPEVVPEAYSEPDKPPEELEEGEDEWEAPENDVGSRAVEPVEAGREEPAGPDLPRVYEDDDEKPSQAPPVKPMPPPALAPAVVQRRAQAARDGWFWLSVIVLVILSAMAILVLSGVAR